MKSRIENFVSTLAILGSMSLLPVRAQDAAGSTPTDPGWPRTFTNQSATVVMHQPQVDAWTNQESIHFRAVVEVTPAGAKQASFGVLAAEAETDVEPTNNTVFICNINIVVHFPYASAEQAAALSALVKDALPNRPYIALSMSRVLSYMYVSPPPPGVALNLAPPPIFYSASPAILVNYMGAPEFKPVKDTKLMFGVNTNWLVLMDVQGAQYYLLNGKSWLKAPDPVNGPWTAAAALPAEFSKLPSDKSWDEVRNNMPGVPADPLPRVFVSTTPAELILTNGTPAYSPIAGTSLMYVNNPPMPVFMSLSNSNYYYLVAGRWFSAPALSGPWSAASSNVPAEFARIPADSPMAAVLPSVPGTMAARDAVMLSSIPHKATVNTANAKLTVEYQGPPQFQLITGTSMNYAVNTSYEVIQANGQFYCCHQGVWFGAQAATGPWSVCTSVPQMIYTIPPTSPLYNVTFVRVYSSNGTSVVVGYTNGYSGEYVSTTGTVMFGSGVLGLPPYPQYTTCWAPYYPCYYSYGCAPCYCWGDYYGYCTGGAAHYGPCGGTGWCASYNPATGTFSRSAYAAGVGGVASVRQAYNPYTDRYGAHARASNGYASWGASTVSQGDKWASASHTTNAAGVTRASASNSSGQWAEAAHRDGNTIATGSNGDLYAGHDGNVYKKTDSGWQGWSNNGWNNAPKATPYSNDGGAAQRATPAAPKSTWSINDWNNNWGAMGGGGGGAPSVPDPMVQHDNEAALNRDAWSRGWGNSIGWGGGYRGGGGFGRR